MSTLETLAIEPNVYYTVDESAQLLRVSPQAILSLLESGKMRGLEIERDWRVLGAALLNLAALNLAALNLAALNLAALNLAAHGYETETSLVADWLAASSRSLQEVWDNEEDAVYDQL